MSADRTGVGAALLSSAGLVVALNLLLRGVNALQQAALAHVFGPGPELDAYATAASLPNLLIGLLILGPLGLALTPEIAGASSEPERERAWRISSAVLSLVALTGLPIMLLSMALARALVWLLAPGLDPDTASLAVSLLRVLLPAVGCAALAAVLRSILHGLRLFTVPLLAYLGSGGLLLAVTLALGPSWGIAAVAWATLAGAVVGLGGQAWVLTGRGARLRLRCNVRQPELWPLGTLVLGASVALAASQLFTVWDRMAASHLGPGQVALLDFALNGDKLISGTIALSIATVSYPALVVARREGGVHLAQATGRMLRLVGLVAAPATVALVMLREPVLRLWLEHGRFPVGATSTVGNTLLYLSPALLAWAFVLPLIMTFHVLRKMRAAAGITLLGLMVNAWAASTGAAWAGLPGLAAGTSLAAALTTTALGVALARNVTGFPTRSVLVTLVGTGVAAGAGSLLAWISLGLLNWVGLPTDPLSDVVRVAVGGVAFAAGFGLLSLLVPDPDLRPLLQSLRPRRFPH